MNAAASLAETIVYFEPSKWFFGALALGTLLVLLIVVTRFNIDR